MAAVPWIFGLFLTVKLQRVGGLSRSPCSREADFNNPKKGYSLDGNVLATLTVNNAPNCVIKCLQHSECQSINFHVSANPEHVCELNSKTDNDVTLTAHSDVIHYGPSQMVGFCKYATTIRDKDSHGKWSSYVNRLTLISF